MKKSKISKKILLFLIIFAFFLAPSLGFGEEEKQYRAGEFFYLDGKNYLIASNKQFVEVLEIDKNDKIIKAGEILGMDSVNDLLISREETELFLYVLTDKKIIKYNISDPLTPEIEFERGLYEWRRWHPYIGYSRSIAGNNNYIFTAGAGGAKRLEKVNLFDNKNYIALKSYGAAANDSRLAVTTDEKGYLFNLNGDIVKEFKIENKESNTRKPVMDYFGNTYFLPDNGIIKIDIRGDVIGSYYNPVEPGVIHSYAASVLPDGEIYYVNGYGVSRFDKNFKKIDWLYTAPSNLFGLNSWAVGVATREVAQGGRVAVFNKSSILLLDENLKLLDQYTYQPLYNSDKYVEGVFAKLSKYQGNQNESVTVFLYGYWPNENIEINFGGDIYSAKTDNTGFASVQAKSPGGSKKGIVVVSATGVDSKINYQVTFNIIN